MPQMQRTRRTIACQNNFFPIHTVYILLQRLGDVVNFVTLLAKNKFIKFTTSPRRLEDQAHCEVKRAVFPKGDDNDSRCAGADSIR
jgi:hypothetical protein